MKEALILTIIHMNAIKYGSIVLGLLFALVGLSQCEPGYVNCEGYKMSPVTEIPARCLPYYK